MILKADLHWLHGFPAGSEDGVVLWQPWCIAGRGFPDIVRVDSSLVARAMKKLAWCQRAFSNDSLGVTELTGVDPPWYDRAEQTLTRLASAVHLSSCAGSSLRRRSSSLVTPSQRMEPLERQLPFDSADAPDSAPSSFRTIWEVADPDERLLLTAIAWTDETCPLRQSRLTFVCHNLSWLRQLRTVGHNEVLQLISMIEDDGWAPWSWLPGALKIEGCFEIPVRGLGQYVAGLINWLRNRETPLPEPPSTSLACQLVGTIRQLYACRASHRRKVLELIPLLLRSGVVRLNRQPWQTLQSDLLPILVTIQQQGRHWNCKEEKAWCDLAQQELSKFDQSSLNELPFGDIFANLVTLAEYARPTLLRSVRAVLRALDDAHAVRSPDGFDPACFFFQLLLLRESAMRLQLNGNSQQLCRYLETVADHVKRNAADPHLFQLWHEQTRRLANFQFNQWRQYLMIPVVELRGVRWKEYLQLTLRASAGDPAFDEDQASLLATLVRVFPDADEAFFQFEQLRQSKLFDCCTESAIDAALQLHSAAYPFASLVKSLSQLDQHRRGYSGCLRILHGQFSVHGWPDLIPRMLCRGEIEPIRRLLEVRRCVRTSLFVTLSPKPRPDHPQLPAWATGLPDALLPAIALFAAIAPGAERVIARLLQQVCPSAWHIAQEIAALKERLASHAKPEHLKLRLQNLEKWLSEPVVLTEAASHRLNEKIWQRLERHVLDDFSCQFHQALLADVERCSGLQDVPRFLANRRYAELIQGLMRLEDPFRSMGFRLLRLQWNGEAWDRICEPENLRFLEQLKSRGLRTDPWLNSATLLTTEYQGKTVRIGFETDVAEILLMGHYFDTCLSPDGFNFFSAVSNAVDVNKRILFARDHHGKVIGRCLLALGDSGFLMTYHPYCHENEFPMSQHVADIAARLAADMGTIVAQHDTVSRLVAPRWYDDHAQDLGNSITSENAPLLLALKTAEESKIVDVLQQCFAPCGLTGTTLTIVMRLPSFLERPELIRPLIPLVRQFEHQLSPEILLQSARLAHQCGASEFAAEILRKYAKSFLTAEVRRCGGLNGYLLDLVSALTEYDPSYALRILRATRAREVRADDEETNATRLQALSTAHAALGRHELARTLRQKTGNHGTV